MADGGEKAGGARVTIRTVAADSGVSVAAVSKVLRNAYGVSDALRLKVERSIEKLGYRPSVAARGMRGQTFTLGVLLVGIDNPFLPQIYRGIASVTDLAGYKVMVGVGAAQSRTEAQLIEQMIDNRMDGLILVAAQMAGDMLEHFARQIPTVVVGHHDPLAKTFDTINSDDVMGARLAVQAFVARGYRDIAMVALTDPELHSADVSPQRQKGYLRAMTEAGLADHARIIFADFDPDVRMTQLRALLTSANRPRALFCWSDLDAIPAVNIAHQLGLRVPQDIAVIGYDNSPVAALPLINLASVDQDGLRLGRLAAEALLGRINGRKVAEHIMIAPDLIRRASL